MSVRYDPLLTRLLAREIEIRWKGVGVRSLGMDPHRGAAALRFADGTSLLALLDRSAGFVVPAGSDPLGEEGVRTTRFGRMSLASVEAPQDERALVLWLAEDDGTCAAGIAIELHTNRWNVLCLSPSGDEWRVRYALWTRDIAGRRVGPGEPYVLPESTRRAPDAAPDEAEWSAWMASVSQPDDAQSEGGRDPVRTAVLETWSWSSALNVEWLLEARGDAHRPPGRYGELHALARVLDRSDADTTSSVWLTSRRWGAQPYPHRLGDDAAEKYPGVFAAMEAALDRAGGIEGLLDDDDDATSLEEEANQLHARLTSREAREAKRVAALQRQLQGAGSPDTARELGQILLARKDEVPRGAVSVVLEAFDGSRRDITLDPSLDAIANAERFFEEARRRERARERLPTEIAGAETRQAAFSDAIARLERDGPSDDLWGLAGGRPAGKKGRKGKKRKARGTPSGEERLPYTRLKSSGGLEIRVGRGSRDNDALTFRHSAPDDIWLHASQSSGAHVVLRWGRRDENPPHRDLLEAAIAAAVNSRGRHSGAVAVSWTRRKYVRKPRKSPPGTVAPDRVQTLLVEPDEDLVRSLREAAADLG